MSKPVGPYTPVVEAGEWLVDVGSEFISAMVGASREMVSRVLKDLIRRNLIRRHKRKIIVMDRGALTGWEANRRKQGDRKKDGAGAVTRSASNPPPLAAN